MLQLKETYASIQRDVEELMTDIRTEIKMIPDGPEQPIILASQFSITLNYEQFQVVFRALLTGERIASFRAARIQQTPTMKRFADEDLAKIAAAVKVLEDLPACAVLIEEGV